MTKKNEFKLPENLIIFDLEATCSYPGDPDFDSRTMETIEIGAIKVIDGVISDKLDVYIRPVIQPVLTTFCLELTGITQTKINSGQSFQDGLKRFINFTEGLPIYSYGKYDLTQLKRDIVRQNDEFKENHDVSRITATTSQFKKPSKTKSK